MADIQIKQLEKSNDNTNYLHIKSGKFLTKIK